MDPRAFRGFLGEISSLRERLSLLLEFGGLVAEFFDLRSPVARSLSETVGAFGWILAHQRLHEAFDVLVLIVIEQRFRFGFPLVALVAATFLLNPAKTSAAGTAGAVVSTATTSLGRVLVDSRGRTLYLFGKDAFLRLLWDYASR